jgi:hypothetical protein
LTCNKLSENKIPMTISNFDDLLKAARQQTQPQRLLFVFASADLPEDATAAQQASFLAGQGGALVPQMCVDKTPDELNSFADLVQESLEFSKAWSIVFVAALAGSAGVAPTAETAQKALQRMVESIKAGTLGTLIPFDREGETVTLS